MGGRAAEGARRNTEDGTEWGPTFPAAEYRQRLDRVKRAMAARGIDLLYVTSPPNLTWLTGYDSIWYRRTTPTDLAIRLDAEATLFFDLASHVDLLNRGTGPHRRGGVRRPAELGGGGGSPPS